MSEGELCFLTSTHKRMILLRLYGQQNVKSIMAGLMGRYYRAKYALLKFRGAFPLGPLKELRCPLIPTQWRTGMHILF